MPRPIRSYRDFWPFYLEEHSKPLTRILHYVGSVLAILLIALAITLPSWWLLLPVPIVGYGFAWVAHFGIERNQPATFTYPLWSLMSDFRMLFTWLGGGMSGEMRKYNIVARRDRLDIPSPRRD